MDLSLRTETFTSDDQSWLGSAHGTQMCRPITLDVSTFTAGTHYPNGYFPSGLPLGQITTAGPNLGKYGPYAGRTNEVQSVTVTGAPTGGTFTLTFGGQTTAGIAYNATAAAVQAALEALSNIANGEAVVTGTAGGPYAVTFKGRYQGEDVPALTASGAGLTGGTSPGVTVGTTTAGGPAATDGTQVFAGFLFTAIKAPAANTTDVVGALFEHGRVITAKLPLPVDSAGMSDAAGRIIFV